MNTITIFLWVSSIAGNIQITLALVAGIGLGVQAFLSSIHVADTGSYKWIGGKKITFVLLTVLMVSGLIPDKQTVHLMLASEIGETVITSPDGQEMLDAIKTRLLKEIKGE